MKQRKRPLVNQQNQRLKNKINMTIRQLFYLIFFCLILLGFYLNFRYIEGKRIQDSNSPIKEKDYWIEKIKCTSAQRSSNTLWIRYKGERYYVEIHKNCEEVEAGRIKPKLYYYKEKDMIFHENEYMPFPFVYLTYIAAFLIPLFGFIFWRKELDNHYSTM